jgi:hypothetical protein
MLSLFEKGKLEFKKVDRAKKTRRLQSTDTRNDQPVAVRKIL